MFTRFNIICDSSQLDTDPYAYADAMEKAFGDLICNIDVGPDNSDWKYDREEGDSGMPNFGQYTQSFEIEVARPMTIEEFDTIMETIDGDAFGFGNGWDHE